MNKRILAILLIPFFSLEAYSQCGVCTSCSISSSSGCTSTVSSSSSTNYTLTSGEKLCITGGTYTGAITFNGGTVVVSSGAVFNPSNTINMNTVTGVIEIKSGAYSTIKGINLNTATFTLNNCGTLTLTGAVSVTSGTVNINNNGIITSNDNISFNSAGTICNNGTMTFRDFDINSASAALINNGLIYITRDMSQNSSSITLCASSRISVTRNWNSNTGSVNAPSTCGAIKVGGTSNCNTCTFTGFADICDQSGAAPGNSPKLDNNTSGSFGSSVSYCTCSALTLPITLLELRAFPGSEGVWIEWKTAVEINNEYFTVEKSIDGVNYQLVSKVKGAGNTREEVDYAVVDEKINSGILYYRLSQTDFDGTKTSFAPVAVVIKKVTIFPNPVVDYLNFSFYSESTTASIYICDISGKVVFNKEMLVKNGLNALTLDLSFLSKGMYVLKAETSAGVLYEKFLK